MITYYHHFRTNKPAKYNIQLCVAESCKSCGSDALHKQIENETGAKMHGHTNDAHFSIEPVYCLGLYAASPLFKLMMIFMETWILKNWMIFYQN